MPTTPMRLVTVIAEPVLEERIIAALRQLGATGHTASDVRGAGSRGIRASDPPGTCVQIQVVCRDAVADAILAHVAEHYFEHYAVIAWTSAVEVVRGEKYQ